MKLFSVLISMVLFYQVSLAQDNFTVIKVTGKVLSQKSNKPLVSGDKIESKDALKFESKDAYLILFSPKTGRKMIKGVPDNSPREFMQLLQSFVKPSEKSTATRNAGLKYIEKLEHMLTVDTLLVLGNGRINIETNKLNISKPAGMRVIYKSGDNNIIRKISNDDSFSLSQSALFSGEVPIPLPRVSIQYYKDEAEDFAFADGAFIGRFVPVYGDDLQLKSEIKTLNSILSQGNLSSEERFNEIKGYLALAYGGTIDENLNTWLATNQLIK
jgi:hypothetical protein